MWQAASKQLASLELDGAAAAAAAAVAPVPLQLLPPSQRVHFRLMWQSAPQGFIVLVQIGLGLLPMAADAVRPAAAPGWSPLPPPSPSPPA